MYIGTILLPSGLTLLTLPAVSLPSVTTGSLAVGSRLGTATPITVASATDHTITLDATAAPIVVSLPALTASLIGKQFTFKKVDVTANTVTITPAGADTLDGAATAILGVQYSSLGLEAIWTRKREMGSGELWVAAGTLIGFVAQIGVTFYWGGKIANEVAEHARRLAVLESKVDGLLESAHTERRRYPR